MIVASSSEGDTILDPFWSSGTLLRVCQQTSRNGIGIDNNPEYIKMTNEKSSYNNKNWQSLILCQSFPQHRISFCHRYLPHSVSKRLSCPHNN